jgi:glycosyltransferase involved in cell wall biosynthesis
MFPEVPRVSVLMPLYNKAAFVEHAVSSVILQEYKDFELIIVDDGSTDDGVARVKARFNDNRLKIICQANAGVGAARNRAFCQSGGMLIAFLDADDEWQPNHLSDLVYLAEDFPSAGIFTSRVATKLGENLEFDATLPGVRPCLLDSYFAILARPGALLIHTSSCAVRRDVITRLGGFLEATPYGEDQEYWARVCLSYPLAFHPSVSAIYRAEVPGSAMSSKQWTASEMPVVGTLKRYLASHPEAANRAEVLNYTARIILNQAANGIASGESRAAARLLSDPILTQSRFQHRLRVLRIAAALPEGIRRTAIQIHRVLGRRRRGNALEDHGFRAD